VPEIFLEAKWGHSGGLGAVPPVESRSKAPDQGVRGHSPPEADDVLLTQLLNFAFIAMFIQKCNSK